MTDPKEPPKEEAAKAEDEKKSETEDKEVAEDKAEETNGKEEVKKDTEEVKEDKKEVKEDKEEEKPKEKVAAAAKATKKKGKKNEPAAKAVDEEKEKDKEAAKDTKKRKADDEKETEKEAEAMEEDEEEEKPKKDSKKRKKDEPAAEKAGDDDEKKKEDENGKPKREKRERKSAVAFIPDNYLAVDKSLHVAAGRGTKLAEIAEVKASIDTYTAGSPELMLAHRLLYTRQGKPAKREIKKNVLEFSGFLPKAYGQDKKELEALEEEAETKMSGKAFKLTIPQIKKLCDVFHVDRTKLENKDVLVDALLDFLGAPSEDQLKGAKKQASKKKKATSSSTTERDDVVKKDEPEEDDDEDDDVPLKTGQLPSDDALRKWVRAYVRCFNLKKATIKHAIATASDKFGVDVSKKKALIKVLLTSEM